MVLVTGAAGSLGTRLASRLARLGAGSLVLVDNAEAPLVELATSLREEGIVDAVPVLADIRSAHRALDVVARYQPDIVFHVAAYKQLPLLEAFPVEGVAANILGTKHMVDAAGSLGVERFVLFSTDKAVQPTCILGQTKAIAELIVATAGYDTPERRYTSVRLGNVVDSAGSILPLFRRQIARGGPLTVTDPRATRYLMTSAEAVGLAIVAGAVGDSDGVYWLDLDPPVRVLELAWRLVRASSTDVGIDFVGLRDGESLHEQLFTPSDEIATTACDRVYRSTLARVDPAWLTAWIAVLERHVDRASSVGVRATLAEMHAAPRVERTASDARIA
ncbi:MAG: SDR family NAD(P)-dependent oxidoreductase [Actinomycetota bacterium]